MEKVGSGEPQEPQPGPQSYFICKSIDVEIAFALVRWTKISACCECKTSNTFLAKSACSLQTINKRNLELITAE